MEHGHNHHGALRILHVIDHLGPGGAQRFLLDVARSLDQEGWNLALCSLRGPRQWYDEAEQLGIPVWYLGRKAWDPRQFTDLVRLLRSQQIDLVHTHLGASAIIGPLAARAAQVPFVIVHDHSGEGLRRHIPAPPLRMAYLAADRAILQLVDRVVQCSEAVATYRQQTHRAPKNKLEVIPNFVDLTKIRDCGGARLEIREELGLSERTLVVGTAGRLMPVKGHGVLLDAMAKLLHNSLDIVLLLVGDGPLRQTLENQAATLGLSDRVRFAGWRNDAVRLIAGMDIFVMPSLSETFGIALVEAMALGKPVVASAVGGMSEIISSGEIGVLVPPNDSLALARAIENLVVDHGLRDSFGAAAKRRVKEYYSLGAATAKMARLYTELISDESSRMPIGVGR